MLNRSVDHAPLRVARIRLCGEFDIFRKDELMATLSQAQDASVVVLDLSETTFIDATTLSSLLQLRKRIRAGGHGAVHIVGARPHIRKLLLITGLDKVFEVHDHATPLQELDFCFTA